MIKYYLILFHFTLPSFFFFLILIFFNNYAFYKKFLYALINFVCSVQYMFHNKLNAVLINIIKF